MAFWFRRRVLPGFRLVLGITLLWVGMIVLLPALGLAGKIAAAPWATENN
ncbi:MAG: hypothetical protein ACOYMV_03430 [Verrucomicrobiia bacterium]